MTTPKEFFEHGGMNPEMGVSVRDWYAVGSVFLPPLQDSVFTFPQRGDEWSGQQRRP